jgi:hypothetical protein
MRAISAFVHQEDVIMDTMTVREALTFSAMMRLPQQMDREAKVGGWWWWMCVPRLQRLLQSYGAGRSGLCAWGKRQAGHTGMERRTGGSMPRLESLTCALC